MTEDLYFIPIIACALQAADVSNALRQALSEIESLGRQPQYRQGYRQFQQFMAEVVRQEAEQSGMAYQLIAELAAETFVGGEEQRRAALDWIRSRPEWQTEYEQLRTALRDALVPERFPGILVTRDGQPAGKISFETTPGSGSLANVVPGMYSLELETGRLLWEGDLSKRDLVWSAAFPGQPLDLAADTGERAGRPSREISLLQGEIILRVFAGPESGRIVVDVVGPQGGRT